MGDQPWGQQYPVPPRPQPQPYGYGQQPWQQPLPAPHAAMRASHTDRDRTVDVLKAAYAEGRLSREEYGQRFDAASRAQTYGQLAQLIADLPAGPVPGPFGTALPSAAPVPPAFGPQPMPVMPMPGTAPMPGRRVNGMAIASLVMGVLSLPTLGMVAPGAVITGHIAKAQMRASGEEGEGPATIGLALGWLAMGGWVLLFLLAGLGVLN
ncbi:DUF1707 and DUF4190 domain-containing protein [Streptomyces sp. NPDC046866]|uniref:DUF1707 and DUF4190 domain-containing protein n=1 Tax=Streptomyces sp. NPDC046866 TaxID=3154921 RepID=UPI003452C380